jgi:uncharacterized membrane protein YfcA
VTIFASCFALSVAAFAGAFVSGLAGFAGAAVAGAILLRILPPLEAVPLMMACSVGVQAANLWMLRADIQWRASLALIAGGLLGVPIAVYLLQTVDTRTFRAGFGALVTLYAGYMLFRPSLSDLQKTQGIGRSALVGFGGGLIGGLTGMPGALPTIWCDFRGVSKNQQRGLVQPFIATMQIAALVLMLCGHSLPSKVMMDFVISIPALAAGTGLGILMFRSVNEVVFRRTILIVLFFSGLSLVF